MTPLSSSPEFSTPTAATSDVRDSASPAIAEDFPIGCECADPALQIESWRSDALAQPLQDVH